MPAHFSQSLGLYLERKFFLGDCLAKGFVGEGRQKALHYELFRQYWEPLFSSPFEDSWYFRFFQGWRARHKAAQQPPRPVLLSAWPEKLNFRKFYGLKFYYALKEHARVGIVAHGKRGYSFRPKTRARWKKEQDL